MPVALPKSPSASEEGVVQRGLDVAIKVEGPRRDLVLAGSWRPPVERPKPPGEAMGLLRRWRRAVEPRCHPRPAVDLDLHRRDRCAPGSALDGVPEVATCDFGWG